MKSNPYALFIGIGVELVGIVIVMFKVGAWLDATYHWPGYGVAGGILLGLVGWLTHVILAVKKTDTEDSKK